MASAVGGVSTSHSHRSEAVLVLVVAFVMAVFGHASAQVEQEWAARYNGPGNSTDGATAMAVDAAGNVYVTGDSIGLDASADYATVKYDANGNELWVARYSGPDNSSDRAAAIAVDAAGNVYVTGDSVGLDASADYATVKYDANGNELWVARYSGPDNSIDRAAAIAVDAAGNVYVTGDSDGSDPPVDFLTVKYDADGNELWMARYNNSAGNSMGGAAFIALDGSGNVYVSGNSLGAYGYPSGYAMVKYDGSGNELWVARLEYFSLGGRSAVTLDAAGNVYVTGVTPGMGTSATTCATFKYDGSGNEVWRASCGCGYHSGGTGLSLDAAGNVYVTVSCRATDPIPEGYATVKYDSSGELWRARYESESPAGSAVVALDAAGDVYVTGVGDGGATSGGYVTIKYDAGGDELWAARYNGPEKRGSIALDAAGNIYVTGASGGDYATIKMVPSGSTDGGGGNGGGGGGGCFMTAAAK